MRALVSSVCLMGVSLGNLLGQTHHYSPFSGTAYKLSKEDLPKGYGPHVGELEVLGEISLDTLAIPGTRATEGFFPGVDRSHGFGVVLSSALEVFEADCYQLILGTDDGSRLWLDSTLVIDNDGPHQLQLKVDTVRLTAGVHEAKLWYYNAYPPIYALALSTRRLSGGTGCYPPGERPFVTLPAAMLFASDQDTLSPGALLALDTLCHRLSRASLAQLEVVGHTDGEGSEAYNMGLSTRRAEAVLAFLEGCLNLSASGVEVAARGLGESRPVAGNEEEDGRQTNRRVEVLIRVD